jgi:uncharacterized RDD family membrane protein YckC
MAEKVKNDAIPQGETYELAGLVDRLVANIIDNVILIIPIMIIQFLLFSSERPLPSQLVNFVFMAIPVAYHWYFWTHKDGQTPGKFALGIRVVKMHGGKIRDVDAVIRAIGYHVSAMLFGIGFIWAIFDKRNQTWHDKIARTYVVRTNEQRKTVTIGE